MRLSGSAATVGAGARLGDLDAELASHGRALPSGCGRSVGIAGLTLGGGLGLLGRRHGLTCDHLLAAQIVLADGSLTWCDAAHEPDLYWALRGAGCGQFGVITSLTFGTVPAPTVTCFRLEWAHTHAAAVLHAWQAWAPTAPDHINAELRLSVTHRAAAIEMRGVIIHDDGPAGRNGQLLDLLVAQVGRGCRRDLRRTMTYTGAKRELAEPAESAGTRPTLEFSKSEFFRRQLPEHGNTDLLANLTRGRVPGQRRSLSFTPWGGAYNHVPSCATAFAHRGELFLLEHLVRVDNEASPADQAAAHAWLDRSWTVTHPFGAGRVYPNLPDTTLRDWAPAYHASNLERLLEVKRRYDPDGCFRFPPVAGRHHPPPRPQPRQPDAQGSLDRQSSQVTEGRSPWPAPVSPSSTSSPTPRRRGRAPPRAVACAGPVDRSTARRGHGRRSGVRARQLAAGRHHERVRHYPLRPESTQSWPERLDADRQFIGAGTMFLLGAAGLHRVLADTRSGRWGARLLGGFAVSLLIAGLFPTDPAHGYPIGSVDHSNNPSWHGFVHATAPGLGIVLAAVACLLFARRFATEHRRGPAIGSAAVALLMFAPDAYPGPAGTGYTLALAVTGTIGFTWCSAVAADPTPPRRLTRQHNTAKSIQPESKGTRS